MVSASGTAEVQLDSLKPLVFVGQAVDPGTFRPPVTKKWLVSSLCRSCWVHLYAVGQRYLDENMTLAAMT